MTEKPPYLVPSVAEISAAVPPDAPTLISTFSGAGGGCLGFRMAGFRTVFASEFVPAAREVYAANFPGVPIDPRDVRELKPEDVLAAAGLAVGECDVMEGSPPCASFSTAGKREQHWGSVKKYSDTEQRTDDLFFEYVRLMRGIRPKVFVAENVSGLVKGVAKGFFKQVLAEMKSSGYRVECRMLDAQWLGVPQARARMIFIGVRDDLGRDPAFPAPLPYRYSVRDALGVPPGTLFESRTGPHFVTTAHGVEGASPTITLRPKDFVLITNRGERSADEPAPTIQTHGNPGTFSELTIRPEERGLSIEGMAIGAEYEKLAGGEQSDRYFNLVRPDPDAPCPTVTQLGGANAGVACVTHPTEKRKFHIWELKRICGFPDDFVLTGTYAKQWERLGRAVPPPMMAAVARTIREKILR